MIIALQQVDWCVAARSTVATSRCWDISAFLEAPERAAAAAVAEVVLLLADAGDGEQDEDDDDDDGECLALQVRDS